MKQEHKHCLKRVAAAALVMLMVSGTVPYQPIAEVFDTAIVASADSVVSDWSANDSLPTTAGSYKLTTDVTLSSKWEVTEDITLDLNGHGIIRTGGNGNAIRVKNNATLTINDSGNTTHYFDVVDGIAKNINDVSGEQSFIGGYITGGTGEGFDGYFWGDGGGVYVLHGNCIMNGGTLLGNSSGFGGGAEVYDGTFTLNGGKIAYNGGNGAVVVRSGSSQYNIDGASNAHFVMNGGEISNNINYGLSRLYCYGESSVTLNAGKICNNGGGGADVYNAVIKDIEITGNTQLGLSGSQITLSGSPVITGNGGDTPKNLVVNIDNPVRIENLGDDTNIGVTMNNPGVFTIGFHSTDNTADPSDFFTADDTTGTFVEKDAGGEAKLGIYFWTASFNANDGSGTMDSTEVLKSKSFNLPACTFTAPEGKAFNGWLSSDDNKVYQAGTQLTLTTNTTFTAQWVEGVSVDYGLSDSYGDGWNGNQLIVREKGSTTPIATLTLNNGRSSSGSLDLPYGKIYELVWVKGSYSGECSFNFKDPYSDNVFTASRSDCSSYTNGQVITTFYPPECYISSAVVTFDYMHIPYTGSEITPHFTVKLDGKELIQGTDYEITDGGSAVGDENGSTQTLKISGIGNYTGTASAEWYIDKVQSYTVEVTNGTVKNAASAQYKEKTLATVVGNTEVGGWYINDKLVSTDKTYSFYVMENTVLEWKDGAVESNGIANMSLSDRFVYSNGKTTVTVTVTATWSEIPDGAVVVSAGTYRALIDANAEVLTKEQMKKQTFKASKLKTQKGTFYYNINMSDASAQKTLCLMTYVQYKLNGETKELLSDVVTSNPKSN